MDRISKANYYLDIASDRSGAGHLPAPGLWGHHREKRRDHFHRLQRCAPGAELRGSGLLLREAMQVPRGERYELCRSVHAEMNAIISAARRDMVGGTLYRWAGTPDRESWEMPPPCAMPAAWSTPG